MRDWAERVIGKLRGDSVSPASAASGELAPGKKPEAVLPKLTFTQLARSPDRVVEVSGDLRASPEAGLVLPYHEYTLVLAKDRGEIQVMDAEGRKVNGLDNMQTVIVDWPQLAKRSNGGSYEYVCRGNDYNIDSDERLKYKLVGSFPHRLQPYLEKALNSSPRYTNNKVKYMDFPSSSHKWEIGSREPVKIGTAEGIVVFFQVHPGLALFDLIAFQTHNEQGVELAPRNWKRFDSIDNAVGGLPPEIYRERLNLEDSAFMMLEESERRVVVPKDRLVVQRFKRGVVHHYEDEFTDRLAGVGNNLCRDPKAEGVIYYCVGRDPVGIIKLDTSGDSANWRTQTIDFPNYYANIKNLQIDPTGNFFMFETDGNLVILAKDNLVEMGEVPNFYGAKIDEQGRIRGIDKEGHLVVYEVNFGQFTQELEKRRLARVAQGLSADLFKSEAAPAAHEAAGEEFAHLKDAKSQFEAQFSDQLQAITSLEDMAGVSEALGKLRSRMAAEGLDVGQIAFITRGIEQVIGERERVLAGPVISQGLTDLSTKLSGNLTIAMVAEAKGDLAKLKSLEGLADEATRAQIRVLENQYIQQSAELFRREGAVIEKDVSEMVTGVREELEGMAAMADFADWQEFRMPQLAGKLGMLANDCPLEAHETQKKILAARRQLQELSREYETRFREKYVLVRERASEVMSERVELMRMDMDSLADRLRARGFKDRAQAEIYVGSSEALETLRVEIAQLVGKNPDAARELDRELKVKLATIMSEIERGGLTSIAETGQQMILFGNTQFPRWEGKIQEKVQRHVDLVFIPDEKTKGPGVTADKVLGDVGIMEINSRGNLAKRRLYEGTQNEDERRLGAVSYRGEYAFPSYVSQAEYRKIKQAWADWSRGDASKIRLALREKRQELREWYKERQPRGERDTHADDAWGAKYRELLSDYAKYAADNHVLLLSRVDNLRRAPETEFANGSGYVPEWSSHWTVDWQTESSLEEMAKDSKMQLDLGEGLLLLKGHAGTGKDVLVKMFANRTNRPYFAIDCSKWTTEFELSEDVVLEAEDGASKTVKVPSVVLNAITTPGAVMYFNEINAMPEQAQIFLHGLMDEKRTLTLKTSSGKAVKTLDSVLLMGSMNPGYPGTFNPQFATRSRMVSIGIDYPPLFREKDPNDPNPNPPISAAEALRAARQVDSLADFTYEANPAHNEFIRIWDRHVNGIENGAPDLTAVQKFDIEAILTMVEFAQKLREGFILKFEKARASAIPRGTLLVSQPITGRDIRRCAYFLSKMSAEEKATADPETVARDLLNRLFLENIDDREERNQIRTAMATWTSSKRPAV